MAVKLYSPEYRREVILKLGQEAGDIRDDIHPLQLAGYLNGILLFQFSRWLQQGAGADMCKLAMEGLDFFLVGALSTVKSKVPCRGSSYGKVRILAERNIPVRQGVCWR